jgi:hypothetical protein
VSERFVESLWITYRIEFESAIEFKRPILVVIGDPSMKNAHTLLPSQWRRYEEYFYDHKVEVYNAHFIDNLMDKIVNAIGPSVGSTSAAAAPGTSTYNSHNFQSQSLRRINFD